MADKKTNPQETNAEEIVSRSEQFVEKNISKIITVVLIVIAVVAGILAYVHFIKKPRNEKASAKMYVAEDKFMNSQDSVALNGLGAGNPGLLNIIDKYSGTDASNLSEAYTGICYYDMGKYKEALEHLKKFSSKEDIVAPSIQRLIGDCYVQLDKLKDAVDAYEKAATMANNEAVTPSCLLKAGHVYEKMGENKKALEKYQTIKDKYYTAPESATVEADIIRVQSKIK
ncbi:CDC27 family protein [Porphyromonas pogonae]|uniref:tetratricopeptide repeat protein n=1 Tax=Porphyromonas pogonae TaxID=867595 RepID=UPI002E76C88E|nr:CDC27 family protein [Porphyromonas pogonae]